MKMSVLIFLSVFLTRCQEVERIGLNFNKWSTSVGGCEDVIFFESDGSYVFYQCEMGDSTFGTYELNNDTLILFHTYSSYDREFASDSRHKSKRNVYEFRLELERLKPLRKGEYYEDSRIEYSSHIFDKNYYFTPSLD